MFYRLESWKAWAADFARHQTKQRQRSVGRFRSFDKVDPSCPACFAVNLTFANVQLKESWPLCLYSPVEARLEDSHTARGLFPSWCLETATSYCFEQVQLQAIAGNQWTLTDSSPLYLESENAHKSHHIHSDKTPRNSSSIQSQGSILFTGFSTQNWAFFQRRGAARCHCGSNLTDLLVAR